MRKIKFTFRVPNMGTVRVDAEDLSAALMEVADIAGIQMMAAVRPMRTQSPYVVARGKSRVSNA